MILSRNPVTFTNRKTIKHLSVNIESFGSLGITDYNYDFTRRNSSSCEYYQLGKIVLREIINGTPRVDNKIIDNFIWLINGVDETTLKNGVLPANYLQWHYKKLDSKPSVFYDLYFLIGAFFITDIR